MPEEKGLLILVFGPSGAGKDALIDAAREKRPDIAVPLRIITRMAEHDTEAHECISDAEFEKAEDNGNFMLSWHAHGLRYGIPTSVTHAIESGKTVLLNVSRNVILRAEALGYPLALLFVTASEETRKCRITARKREDASAVESRMAREVPLPETATRIYTVDNDGTLDEGIANFMSALNKAERLYRSKLHATK